MIFKSFLIGLFVVLFYPDSSLAATKTISAKLSDVDLFVEYIWPSTGTDLDTSTRFLDGNVGHFCSKPTDFISGVKDQGGAGGTESTAIFLNKALNEKKLPEGKCGLPIATAYFRAGYHLRAGPAATIRVSVRNAVSRIPINDASLSMTIQPGSQQYCAEKDVGYVTVQELPGDKLQMTLDSGTPGAVAACPVRKALARCSGDPHCYTYDQAYFNCQGTGEFLLTKSSDGQFEVEGRFGGKWGDSATINRGLAVKQGSAPIVQVTATFDGSGLYSVENCLFSFKVGGLEAPLAAGTVGTGVQIKKQGTHQYSVFFPDTQNEVFFHLRQWVAGVCVVDNVRVEMLSTFFNGRKFCGMFGSPDGDVNNDWLDKNCNPLTLPSQYDRERAVGTDHCKSQWQTKNFRDSLFDHKDQRSLDEISSRQFTSSVKFSESDATVAIRRLCGADFPCVMDGAVLTKSDGEDAGLTAAKQQLEETAAVARRRELVSDFTFVPSLIRSLEQTDISVRIDLSAQTVDTIRSVQKFHLYELDTETSDVIPNKLVDLLDNGAAANADDASGDGVFSGKISVRSSTVGESLSYRAVPVINGEENDESPLARTEMGVIRSFGEIPGEPEAPAPIADVILQRASLADLELTVRYTWPSSEKDMDSSTHFLNLRGGPSCSPLGQYLNFFGDVSSSGGSENALVRLGLAETDRQWSGATSVKFHAGYDGRDGAPAELRVVLRDATNRKELAETEIVGIIEPKRSSGCPTHAVAELKVEKVGEEYHLNMNWL